MSKNNNKKLNLNFLIMIIIIILFFIFLISLPTIFNEEKTNNIGEDTKTYTDSSNFLEENKFNYISETIITDLKHKKISDENSPYILNLISNNQIDNRDNSIGQEILYLYLNEKPTQARELATNFIENRLDLFDSKVERKWRNEVLYLIDGEDSIELYEHAPLLKSPYDAQTLGVSVIKISPYQYQIYKITLNNDSEDIIKIDLSNTNNNSNAKLNKYLGIENKDNYKYINSSFIESNKTYEFKFLIWK